MRLDRLQGKVIDERFRLRKMVGKGGYGAVFEAEQLSVGRRCAVKVLLPARADDEKVEKRFRAEARVTSRLTHPNSVVLYDFGVDEAMGYLFLATEYIDGVTLHEVLDGEGPLEVERCLGIVEQIAASLGDAHEMGLVHRDVKPKNIMLVERGSRAEFVKVIDFGIAKALNMTSDLTATGTLIGTPQYMSPEQLMGLGLDGRSDQYALAVMIYKMLSGRNPFLAASTMDTAMNHVHQRPMPLRSYSPGLDVGRDFEDVLLQALEKSPEHRFATMEVFVRALENARREDLRGVGRGVYSSAEAMDALPTLEVAEELDGDESDVDETAEEAEEKGDESGEEGGMVIFETQGFTRGTELVTDLDWEGFGAGGGEEEAVDSGEEAVTEEDRNEVEEEVKEGRVEVRVPKGQERERLVEETASVEVGPIEEGMGAPAPRWRRWAVGAVAVAVMAAMVVVGGLWEGAGDEEVDADEASQAGSVVERKDREGDVAGGDREDTAEAAEEAQEAEKRRQERRRAVEVALGEVGQGLTRGAEEAERARRDLEERMRQREAQQMREEPETGRPVAEARAAATGTVVVTMIPWGELKVDGELMGGQTRQELELEAGVRRLEMVQRGEVKAVDEVEVSAGQRDDIVLRAP